MPRLNLTHWYLKLSELNITRLIFTYQHCDFFQHFYIVALNSLLLPLQCASSAAYWRSNKKMLRANSRAVHCAFCYCYFVWLVDAWQMILHIGEFCAWMHVNSRKLDAAYNWKSAICWGAEKIVFNLLYCQHLRGCY